MKVTPFQQRVYDATRLIPKGWVTTYQAIANQVGCKSPRAVGQALRCNPFAPEVPCHRVISSNLMIGGFFGQTTGEKITEKLNLLALEGVEFQEGKLMDASRLISFI